MKFINYLESMSGIGIYPMISLLLFFGFFIALFVWVLFLDKKFVSKMRNLPLDTEDDKNETVIGI